MADYQQYINALRKCAKEHENDRTLTGHIRVSDLCRDTANFLEALLSNNLCSSCTNMGCESQSGIVKKECAFYMPPCVEPNYCGDYVVTQPTVRNEILTKRFGIPMVKIQDREESGK